MKHLIFIGMLLVISISCYAQGAQESYTVLMLDFEDRTGLENPLLEAFDDTISFVLSRQAGPVQVSVIPKSYRDALMARVAATEPGKTPLEQGLLVAEWVDADALTAGSYTKQGTEWSLEAEVYHRRAGRKTRKEIQIQGDNVYKLLDGFPAQLLQQFTDASYVALTTDSWKAYEEFRKGLQQFEYYNFLGALQQYEKAIALDPTLALAYAEQSHVYALMDPQQVPKAIEAAQKWMSKASPIEQLAIQALAYTWNPEQNEHREWLNLWEVYGVRHLLSPIRTTNVNLISGGVWNEPLIYQLVAFAAMQNGKRAEADRHNQQWFKAIQQKILAYPEDASLLHETASYCLGIGRYLDEAIEMELTAIELPSEVTWRRERYILSRLYERKGDMEKSLAQAKQFILDLPDRPNWLESGVDPLDAQVGWFWWFSWNHLGLSMREGRIPPERLLRWCEEVLSSPNLEEEYRIHTQYLLAETYNAMGDSAKEDATLAAMGATRENDWMVIGPFETSAENLIPKNPPFAELFANVSETHEGILGKTVKWESWEDDQPFDGYASIWKVLNRKYYGRSDPYYFQIPAIVYSCIYVEVPTAVEAQMRMRSQGPGPVQTWLYNKPTSAEGVVYTDEGTIDISLNAGRNQFIIATVSGGSTGFDFRITDRDGKAIPGLEFVSAEEVIP
jgi:hypothetical protein